MADIMTVSFLIPTRQRVESLLGGIHTIRSLASPDVLVEILVRIDEDDTETLVNRERILNAIGEMGEIIVGPRWCGYDCVYMFYNEMAAKSHGDWLVCWNDDTFMVTPRWDKLLAIDRDHVRIIWLHSPTSWTWAFPVINRKLYDLWGCFSPGIPSDAIIFEIWRQAGKVIPNPNDHSNQIVIDHRRNEDNIRDLTIKSENKVLPVLPINKDYKDFVSILRDAI